MGAPNHASNKNTVELWKTFEELMDKSQRCFNRLREIPPYVKHHWESYFHKAFHVYARLWKFQQDHRDVLTEKGLKRWEIGDMASKIGQLYYNYYLRTSETRFLQEAYTFYEAIRARQYFQHALNDQNLAIKQLRYYARFIIICLLMNRREEVFQLLQEFQAVINSYNSKFNAADAHEWKVVIAEITTFLEADRTLPKLISPTAPTPFQLTVRCTANSPEARVAPHKAKLREAILISYYHKQVKIAELPLDTYRMLQTLEWEDLSSAVASPSTPSQSTSLSLDATPSALPASPHENPTKHLMFRPTAPQVLAMASTICDALPRESILLLYICANAQQLPDSRNPDPDTNAHGAGSSASRGGPDSRKSSEGGSGTQPTSPARVGSDDAGSVAGGGGMSDGLFLGPARSQEAADCFLLPEDLIPFTRQQLFLVVDSDISLSFCRLQGYERSRPCMCLMSPLRRPPELQHSQNPQLSAHATGNLFTNFLSSPALAFCLLCNVLSPSPETLNKLQDAINSVLHQWGLALGSALANTRSVWASAYQDVLLRRHVLRFVLCRAVMSLHQSYGSNLSYIPSCFPDLPPCAAPTAADVVVGVASIAKILGREGMFTEGEREDRGKENEGGG